MARRPSTINTDLTGQFRGMRDAYRADYMVGDNSPYVRKRKGLFGSADDHLGSATDFYRRIEVARDLYRSEPIVAQLVERAATQTMRSGFDFEPDTGSKALDDLLFDRMHAWRMDPALCSEDGEMCFPDIEKQLFVSTIVDGEILYHIPPEDLRTQMFEADEIRPIKLNKDRNHVLGVDLGENRRRLRYYIVKPGKSLGRYQSYTIEDLTPIDAYNWDETKRCLHLFNNGSRAKATRGITAFHSVIEMIGMYGDIAFTMLVKQQMGASLAWEEQQTEKENKADAGYGETTESEMTVNGGVIDREGIQPGAIIRTPWGKKLHMHSPALPSSEAQAHLRSTMECVANALGLPLLVATMNAAEGSFSTVRFCFDIAKMGFIANQDRMERKIHRPLAQRNIRYWIKNDPAVRAEYLKLPDPARVFNHKWKKPGWPYPQPMHDAQADALQIETYTNDPYTIASGKGRDADNIRDMNIKFTSSVIRAAIKESDAIYAETKVRVPWRDIANRSLPKGGQVIDSLDLTNADDETPPPKKTPPAAA